MSENWTVQKFGVLYRFQMPARARHFRATIRPGFPEELGEGSELSRCAVELFAGFEQDLRYFLSLIEAGRT